MWRTANVRPASGMQAGSHVQLVFSCECSIRARLGPGGLCRASKKGTGSGGGGRKGNSGPAPMDMADSILEDVLHGNDGRLWVPPRGRSVIQMMEDEGEEDEDEAGMRILHGGRSGLGLYSRASSAAAARAPSYPDTLARVGDPGHGICLWAGFHATGVGPQGPPCMHALARAPCAGVAPRARLRCSYPPSSTLACLGPWESRARCKCNSRMGPAGRTGRTRPTQQHTAHTARRACVYTCTCTHPVAPCSR
jgi:hypothetical protein